MEGKDCKSIAQVARIPKLRLYYSEYLQFCPQCLAEDLQHYGEMYWHRLHQVAGVRVCLIHGVGLENSKVLVSEMGKVFVAADEENCVGDGVSYDEAILRNLREFGRVIEGKMSHKGSFPGLKGLRDGYKEDLMRLGLTEERLAEAMLDRYGEEVLRVIHPEMMEGLGEYVWGCLLGCDLLPEVDRVVHWLVEGI